jgi:excisionase family DNA binding protein
LSDGWLSGLSYFKGDSVTDEILTVEQVAAELQVTKWTVYNLVSRPAGAALAHIKVGRALRFRRSSLEKWLAENETLQ